MKGTSQHTITLDSVTLAQITDTLATIELDDVHDFDRTTCEERIAYFATHRKTWQGADASIVSSVNTLLRALADRVAEIDADSFEFDEFEAEETRTATRRDHDPVSVAHMKIAAAFWRAKGNAIQNSGKLFKFDPFKAQPFSGWSIGTLRDGTDAHGRYVAGALRAACADLRTSKSAGFTVTFVALNAPRKAGSPERHSHAGKVVIRFAQPVVRKPIPTPPTLKEFNDALKRAAANAPDA